MVAMGRAEGGQSGKSLIEPGWWSGGGGMKAT